MPRCPHCNEEVTELHYRRLVEEYGTCYVPEGEDYLDHDAEGDDRVDRELARESWQCPHCDEDIDMSYDRIVAWLSSDEEEAPQSKWSTNSSGVSIQGGDTWTTIR